MSCSSSCQSHSCSRSCQSHGHSQPLIHPVHGAEEQGISLPRAGAPPLATSPWMVHPKECPRRPQEGPATPPPGLLLPGGGWWDLVNVLSSQELLGLTSCTWTLLWEFFPSSFQSLKEINLCSPPFWTNRQREVKRSCVSGKDNAP